MSSLDTAVDLVLQWTSARPKQREEILALLEDVIAGSREGIRVWQGYLEAPGDQWTLVSWLGPERARQLHEINLKTKERVERVCLLAGPEAGRFAIFDNDVIEMAYRQLNPGETGAEAAKTAIQVMGERIDHLRGLIERIRTTKPPAKKATVKKKAVKVKKKTRPARAKKKPAGKKALKSK